MPNRSRAAKSVSLGPSQSTKANSPRRLLQAGRAEVFVEVQGDLAVGAGAEAMAPALEVLAASLEVVELAVDDDLHRSSSLAIGWSPVARSMMLSRAWPSPTRRSSRATSAARPDRGGRVGGSPAPGRRPDRLPAPNTSPRSHTCFAPFLTRRSRNQKESTKAAFCSQNGVV